MAIRLGPLLCSGSAAFRRFIGKDTEQFVFVDVERTFFFGCLDDWDVFRLISSRHLDVSSLVLEDFGKICYP